MLQRLDLRGHTGDLAERLPAPAAVEEGPTEVVRTIVERVRDGGDVALRELTARFDGAEIDDLRVPPTEIAAALESLEPKLRRALVVAADAIADFHRHQLASTARPTSYRRDAGGGAVRVDTVFRPVDRAGCYVPGGRARYPSTVLHTAGIARVAGVSEVVVCCPPGIDGGVPAITLAAAAAVGVDEVFRIGGAQAIGALAYGTESIRPVDVIVGPGNIYVATAQREVAGRGLVGVPSAFAGPSEIVIVADDTTPPDLAAVDLIVQAEHGPLGQSWLLTWSPAAADAIVAEVARQLDDAPRHADIEATFASGGYVVLCDSPAQAAGVVDVIAPEHLQVMTADPDAVIEAVHHAGAVFRGAASPAAVGDYLAGPSHVLPTARTARFGSALGVRDFLKEMHVVELDEAAMAEVAPAVTALATAEGLAAHADAAARRGAARAPAEVSSD